MNKTVNINISGMVFHIEEDAYDALKKYMHEIKLYFSKSAEDTEVVTDIENRIAEMFSEILKAGNREVIVLKDVEGIIAQIGQVSDFGEAAEAEEETFASAEPEAPRRLFRDPEDKKLGGVCAGLSHYFGWDPVWLRIIITLLTIFTSGIVALVYIILWMVMPQAKTLGEKMAMKGERFHLSNFRKSFDEEMTGVKASFNHLKNEVSNPGNATSFKRFINELIDLVVKLISGLGKIILPIIAALLIAFGSIWLISTIVGIVGYSGFSESELAGGFPFNVMDPQFKTGFAISAALVIGIPALALVLLGARLLLKTNVMNAPVGLGMLALWLGALGFAAYYSASTLSGFRQGASIRQVTELKPAGEATWRLELDEYTSLGRSISDTGSVSRPVYETTPYRDQHSSWRDYDDNFEDWDDWDEDLYEVDLKIEQSVTGKAALVQVFNSRGEDFNDAVKNAESVRYEFGQRDSVLRFGEHFSLAGNALWRAQKVELTLQLPANSTLIIDKKLRRILENHEVYSQDFSKVRRWTMTNEGLKPAEQLPADTTAAK